MEKTILEKAIDKLSDVLGRKPTSEEIRKEFNGAGLLLLSDSITGPTGFEEEVVND